MAPGSQSGGGPVRKRARTAFQLPSSGNSTSGAVNTGTAACTAGSASSAQKANNGTTSVGSPVRGCFGGLKAQARGAVLDVDGLSDTKQQAPAPSSTSSCHKATALGAQKASSCASSWVDSHAPTNFGHLVGNASVVRKLSEWLRDWDSVVLRGQSKKLAFKPGGGVPENPNARAALVSGPPGTGKTTTCRLVAKLHGGYDILEYNASDTRGQKVIQEMAEGIADNCTISFAGPWQLKTRSSTRRACLIMDEVDGMGSGDRGGIAALIKMIKKTRNPIMCICNDAHHQKIRSLASSCYDLKFARPPKHAIAQRCLAIARQEGLQVEEGTLEALAESCGGDMRLVLNQLQMMARSPMYKQQGGKDSVLHMGKDQEVMLSPFEACKKLLTSSEGAKLSLQDRLELFFIDNSLMPLLTHENFLRSVERAPVTQELMERCAYSADLMVMGDLINERIRGDQEWGLLPTMGLTGCVYPAHVTNGFISYPSFPQFLGKYSTMSKTRRLCKELTAHIKQSTSSAGSRTIVATGFTGLLHSRLVSPLLQGGGDAVSRTAAVLDAYGLHKEHLLEHLSELRSHLGVEDTFKLVDPKVKAALTREFNSGAHAPKVVIPKRKQKRGGEAGSQNPEEFADEEPAVGSDDEAAAAGADANASGDDDDDSAGAALVKQKAQRGRGGGRSVGSSASSVVPQGRGGGRSRGRGTPSGVGGKRSRG